MGISTDGEITTCPKLEYQYVLGKVDPDIQARFDPKFEGRSQRSVAEMRESPEAKGAHLKDEELICLRLYTGNSNLSCFLGAFASFPKEFEQGHNRSNVFVI